MRPHNDGDAVLRGRIMTTAWLGLPLVLVVWVLLRYGAPGDFAQVTAQIVYLIPPILAAAFTTASAWLATRRTRAKVVWTLLAVASTLMFVSETYFSWTHLASVPVLLRGSVFDSLNTVAFFVLLAMLFVVLGLDRMGWRRSVRALLDGLAVLTVVFIVAFRSWLNVSLGELDWMQATRITAYGLGGVVLFVLVVIAALRTPAPQRRNEWVVLTLSAIAIYSVALMIWPWWTLARMSIVASPFIEVLTSMLFLVGYYVLFLAGLSRVVNASQPWTRVTSLDSSETGTWAGVLVSLSVLAAVVVLAVGLYESDPGSMEQSVYVVGLVIATVCMVARTALAALETESARGRMAIDLVSGALNSRELETRLIHDVSIARRYGERSALLIVDLDDFADVNSAHGRSAGDDALRRVASALSAVSPSSAAVFRLAGDEFAVMSRVNDRREAETLASRLRAAVPDASSPTVRLSASVGFAVSPDDAVSTNTLVDYADVALAFAKQYGGSRSVGFDHRVASALGVHARQPTEPFGAVGPNVAKALIAAYDAREPGNFRHARSVAALACLLAEELQDPSIDSERLRLAAALHDVGKIGLPSAGRVGGGAQVSNALASRAHCDLGARMLKAAHFDDVAAWVLHHHERWDGSGYPSGLSGDAIPLESRIIAIADAFDGLTSRTRLGGPMSRATALQEIDQNISARFDPNLAERFIRLVGSTPALRWTDDWPAA